MRRQLARPRPTAAGQAAAGTITPSTRHVGESAGDMFVRLRARFAKTSWSLTFVAFLAYMFAITTYRLPIGDVAVVTALVGLAFEKRLRFPALLGWFAILLAWNTIGLFVSPYGDVVQQDLLDFAKVGLILLAAANAVKTRSQIRTFIIFWLGCYALYPARGTYLNYFIARYSTFGRALWNYIYSNPNDLAALTILQLSMAAGLLVTEPKGWVRRAALIGVFVLTLLVFMTQSRGALLGLAIFGLLALIGQRHRLRAIAFAAALGGVVLVAAPSGVWTRLEGLMHARDSTNLSQVDKEGSAEQRFEIWQTAGRIIADHPVFGVGWGAYPNANAAYSPLRAAGGLARLGARDTHSTYLNLLAETGVPGFLLFLALIGSTIFHAERIRRRVKSRLPKAARQLYLLELGLLGFLAAGIFASYSRLSFLYLHLVLIYAVAEACRRDDDALRTAVQARVLPGSV